MIRDEITPAMLIAKLPLSFKMQRVKHTSASFFTPTSAQRFNCAIVHSRAWHSFKQRLSHWILRVTISRPLWF